MADPEVVEYAHKGCSVSAESLRQLSSGAAEFLRQLWDINAPTVEEAYQSLLRRMNANIFTPEGVAQPSESHGHTEVGGR